MIEAWGPDIKLIIEACRAAGVSLPQFRYEESGLWAEFAYGTTQKTSEKTLERIPRLLREDPSLTITDLAERTQKTTRTIERNLALLQKASRLRRIGPAKGGYWQVLEKDDE